MIYGHRDTERTTTGNFFFFFSFFLRSGYEMRIGFEKFGWIDLYLGIWVTLGFDLIFLIRFSFSVY